MQKGPLKKIFVYNINVAPQRELFSIKNKTEKKLKKGATTKRNPIY